MNKKRKRGGRGGGRRFVRPEKGKYKPKNMGLPGLRAPNWNNVNLEPFQKNFYREHPNVMNRLRQDVERFRNKHEITVQGMALNPIENFDEVFMPDYVAREIQNQGYAKPTAIQSQTWPIAFSGFNLVGIAQTGSGKTLAYILPAIIHINNQPNIKPGDGPIAVVLAPTRELAVQIQQVAIDFGKSTHIRTVCTVGGIDKKPQEAELLKGCEIVVATPGRLLDFLSANVTNMKRCTYLVLDEADRMLDMGFEAQIRGIISQIRPDKQILMWSATWPREIRQLAEDFLGHYIQVNIGSLELSANHNIKQFVHICQENEKSSKLQLLLRQIYQANNPGKILIFVSKKKRADMISKYINNFGVACESLHGDKPQSHRTKILDDFRSGRSNIIVATDVAARGLDVDGIMYVINLDFPKLIEDYVHRIGRCGRCDRMGISYAFFTVNDAKQAKELIAILNEANQPVDAKLQEIAFNPPIPEKIDKKQRRLNEISGFCLPVPEKRKRDGGHVNTGAGPSSSSGSAVYMEEPDCKRGRPKPAVERNVMFNRNNEPDFRQERNINRGYMDVTSTVRNIDRVDDRITGLRHFEDRNVGGFQSDDRVVDRDFMNNQTSTIQMRERQLEELERSIEERIRAQQRQQRPLDRIDDFRMTTDMFNDRRLPLTAGTSFERGEPVIALDRMRKTLATDFDERQNDDFGRLNDFRDRSSDRVRDSLDDIQRPIRDNLLVGRDHDISRSGPMFNSCVSDRRNYERDSIDNRDTYSAKATNFQHMLNDRVYDERSSVSTQMYRENTPDERSNVSTHEFRNNTPDPILLDRSDVIADRFLNQSRDEAPFDSLPNFGSRRGDFRDRFDSRFDMDDRRNDFVDDIKSNQASSSRWNDFSSRDSYQQDRRDFSNDMEPRRRTDFNRGGGTDFNRGGGTDFNRGGGTDFNRGGGTDFNRPTGVGGDGGGMNFNFTRNNDYNDDSRNRGRRDFERRNIDDRFNRFN